jgi:hypothetical protein
LIQLIEKKIKKKQFNQVMFQVKQIEKIDDELIGLNGKDFSRVRSAK